MKRRKYIKTATLGTGAITLGPTYSFTVRIAFICFYFTFLSII